MSENGCRNDCNQPLRFPRRPGTHIFVGSGSECFCCQTNRRISADNRAALSHFNYRIGSYASIREFLFRKIDLTPTLRRWTHREPDDPAIALLEGAAILGDILTFYQDVYANEAFLRTAKWHESIAELVRLLGYKLSPGVGGKAVFAFELKKDEAVKIPVGFPLKATLEKVEKPADFETTEEITAYPWLSRFNLFRPLVQENITNSTNEFYISSPNQLLSAIEIKPGDRLMIGESDASGTNQPAKLSNSEIVIVDSVREMHGTKIFKIKGKLKYSGNASKLAVYKLGRYFHHFGYNSPLGFPETPNQVTSKLNTDGSTTTTILNKTAETLRTISAATNYDTVTPNLTKNQFPIDAEITDLPANVPVIIEGVFSKQGKIKGAKTKKNSSTGGLTGINVMSEIYSLSEVEKMEYTLQSSEKTDYVFSAQKADSPNVTQSKASYTLIRTLSEIKSAAVTWGAISGTVSMLKFSSALDSSTGDLNLLNMREVLFHETVSPLFFIKKAEFETNEASGNRLNFYGTADELKNLEKRRIMLEKTGEEAKVLTVAEIAQSAAAATLEFPVLRQITLSEDVDYEDFPNENPKVTVYGNLIEADEGKTLPQAVLGNGDNTTIFQTFKLPKSPLTYHLDTAGSSPFAPELDVFVGGRKWQKVETLFGRGSDEQIYIVREDYENNSWVQFGDGKTGSRLPTGVKNVSAAYRIGNGAYGELKADTKVQAGAKLKNLDKIQMPQVASGGATPESADNARNAAPGKIQSLDRLISLRDIETETLSIPGVALSSAKWKLVDNVPSVAVTVLMETGRSGEFDFVTTTLNSYNSGRGSSRFPIVTVDGKRLYVNVTVEFALDPTFQFDLVKPEIEKALGINYGKSSSEEYAGGLFSLQRRKFGGREYASTIEGEVNNVEGVIWAKVTALNTLSETDEPDAITVLPNEFNEIAPCGGSQVLSLYYKHLILTQVADGGSAG